MKRIKKITDFNVVQIHTDTIPSDVLERIDGYEVMESSTNFIDKMEQNFVLHATELLSRLINDPEDDTNETTKENLKALYEAVKKYKYFTFLK